MALPIEYTPSGACIPFADYIEASTETLRDTLYATSASYAVNVIDTCDLTGAIDAMLKDGAAELKKAMAVVGKLVGEALNAISTILSGTVIDQLLDQVEALIADVMTAVNSVMSSVSQLLEDIKDVIKQVSDGVKTILCEAASGFLNSVPTVAVSGVIAATAIKGLKPSTYVGAESYIDVTDAVAQAAGVNTIISTASSLENQIFNQISILNSLAGSVCGGTSYKFIDNVKIRKEISTKFV